MSGTELATQFKEKPRGYQALLGLAGDEFLKKVFDPDYASDGFGLNYRGLFSKEEAEKLRSIAHPIIDVFNQELLSSLQKARPDTFELIKKHINDFFSDFFHEQRAINQAVYACIGLIPSHADKENSLLANQLRLVIITLKNIFGDNSFLPFQLSVYDPRIIDLHPTSRTQYSDKEFLRNSLLDLIARASTQEESPITTPPRKSLLARVMNSLKGNVNVPKDEEVSNQTPDPSLSKEQINIIIDIMIDAYLKHYLAQAYQSIFNLFFSSIYQQHNDYQEREKEKVEAAIMELERQDYLEFLETNPTARLVALQPIIGFPLLLKTMLFEKDKPEIAEVYRVYQKGKYVPYYSVEVTIEDQTGEKNWKEIVRVYPSNKEGQNSMTTAATAIIADESPEVLQLLKSINKLDLLLLQS